MKKSILRIEVLFYFLCTPQSKLGSKMYEKREKFSGRLGFILSCIGSSVGIGNVWLFPYRVCENGGAVFILLYIFFVITVGFAGMVGEMAFGRAMQSGPMEAFRKVFENKGWKWGKNLGLIPTINSVLLAIGYSVIIGWVLYFLKESIVASLLWSDTWSKFLKISSNFSNIPYHTAGLMIAFLITVFGIQKGIETINKILMPTFFLFFLLLATRVSFLPRSYLGYKFLTSIDFRYFLNFKTYIYALSQAIFSLSLAGSGMVVYGSYLKKDENIPLCAGYTSLCTILASLLATITIIPSVFSFGMSLKSGPALLFITMPSVFEMVPFGSFFSVLFFVSILFAATTSLINMFEAPIVSIKSHFKLSRFKSALAIFLPATFISITIENKNSVGIWMDIISVYFMPFCALLAAITFFVICGKDFARNEIENGMKRPLTKWFNMSYLMYMLFLVFIYIIEIFGK